MDKMVLTGLDKNIISDIEQAVANACAKHPLFATSTHEVVSLATEELGEFAQAVNDKNPELAKKEALDLIAVMVRYLQEAENGKDSRCNSSYF